MGFRGHREGCTQESGLGFGVFGGCLGRRGAVLGLEIMGVGVGA